MINTSYRPIQPYIVDQPLTKYYRVSDVDKKIFQSLPPKAAPIIEFIVRFLLAEANWTFVMCRCYVSWYGYRPSGMTMA
jgi:hypothetical protein